MEAQGQVNCSFDKKIKNFSAVNFFQILVIKTLDPDWIRIWIGIQPKMLDPDQMNADPQPWFRIRIYWVWTTVINY